MDIPDNMKYAGLKRILPPSFEHKIKTEYELNENIIDLIIFANVTNEVDAKTWVAEFENETRTTYKISSTPKVTGTKITYKQYRHCQHKTRSDTVNSVVNGNSRNTNCPSKLSITIRRELKKEKGRDTHERGMPCEIYLYWKHNHPTESSDALRFRPVSDDVKKKLLDLFHKGHSPATAINIVKIDLQHDHPNDYEEYLADRSYCPDYFSCHYLYNKLFVKEYGPVIPKDHKFLEKRLEEINASSQSMKCASWNLTDDQVLIALCTPLMQRAHKLVSQSAELVFIDSSGTVDRDGHRIFILLTHNESGGIPLGVLITNSEASNNLIKGLQMFKDLVGVDGFYGKEDGPSIFMTDDCDSERKALHTVWEDSTLLLCLFHILQAMWRWVLNSKHGIAAEHRQQLYFLFKSIVYAQSEEECERNFDQLTRDKISKKYLNFISHVATQYWQRREEWALCYRARQDLRLRGNNTNNFAEAAMRVLKDKVFERVKAFNLVQMVDFVITRLDAYYERKLLDCAHNRAQSYSCFPKKWHNPSQDVLSRIVVIGSSLFSVPSESEKKSYNVDMDINRCECPVGINGALCKHQVWVYYHTQVCPIPVRSIEVRSMLFELATGKAPRANWLTPLFDTSGQVSEGSAGTSCQEQDIVEDRVSNTECDVQDDGDNDAELEQAVEDGQYSIQVIHNLLKEQLMNSPKEFAPALKKMEVNLCKLKTPAALLSAIVTCGKVAASNRRRGARISVQPTAIARRKTTLSGRHTHVGGRPRVTNSTRRAVKRTLPSRKQPAPHNLQQCVSRNIALGTAHSSKQV